MLTPNKLGRLRDSLRSPLATGTMALPQSANIAAFWNPDTIAGIADGAAMPGWIDSVGGIAMTQATPANQPTYRAAAGPLGKPLVYMGGAASMGTGANAALNTVFASGNYTVMVLYRNAQATTYGHMTSFNATRTGLFAGSTGFTAAGYGATYSLGDYGNNPVPSFASDQCFNSAQVQSVAKVNTAGVGGGFCAVALNGTVSSMPSSGLRWTNNGGTFCLGYPASPSFNYKGEILGIVIWSVNLTAVELYLAHKAFARKYGQQTPAETYGKMIVAAGDSQTFGLGDTNPYNDNYAIKAFRSIGIPLGAWMNLGQSSQQTPNLDGWMVANLDGLPAATGVPTHLSYLEAYNIRNNANPAGVNLTYCVNRKAAGFGKIGLLTCYDDNAHWNASTATSGARKTYVDALVAGYATNGVSDLIRVDQNSNVGVIGCCPNASPYGTYFADGVHLTTAGDEVVRTIYQPVVAAW